MHPLGKRKKDGKKGLKAPNNLTLQERNGLSSSLAARRITAWNTYLSTKSCLIATPLSGYLELFQFFLCFSGDEGPREQPKRCSHRPSWLQPPEHHSPAHRCGECPLQRWPNKVRQKNIRCQNSYCASPSTALTSCQLSYESQVAWQTWFDSWETTWGNPSLSLLSEQFQSSTEWVFLQQEGQTWTVHACLSTLISCMYRLRNRNEQPCFFQLVCYVHHSKKNNKHSILWFLSLCMKQFREYVLSVQLILSSSPVKFMKVNDMAQIAAWSRTFMLDNPLETVTLNVPVHTFCREVAISSEHWLFPPVFLEETAIAEWKIMVKLEHHQEAGETNCFIGQNYLHRTFEREQNV